MILIAGDQHVSVRVAAIAIGTSRVVAQTDDLSAIVGPNRNYQLQVRTRRNQCV